MAGGIASAMGGSSSGGGSGWLSNLKDKLQEKINEKNEAASGGMAEGGSGVQPHGDEAHTGSGNKRALDRNPSAKSLFGAPTMGALTYKMPASGAKYGNSPINKNFGDAEARGFKPSPEKMNTFGVGDSNKEKMSGVGSDLLDK